MRDVNTSGGGWAHPTGMIYAAAVQKELGNWNDSVVEEDYAGCVYAACDALCYLIGGEAFQI